MVSAGVNRVARMVAWAGAAALAYALAMVLAPAQPSSAASSTVNVSLSILSTTTVDTTGCSTANSYSSEVMADAPLHQFRLGESAGATNARDSAGIARGAYTGAYTAGQAGALAGSSDTSVLLGGGVVNLTGLGVNTANTGVNTVEFWMRWNGTDDVVPFGFDYLDLWINGGRFGFNTGNGDIYGISGATVTGMANRWVHVAAVFRNGDYTLGKLYIDGVQQSLSQVLGAPDNSKRATSTGYIGGNGWTTAFRFGGSIDELAIYPGELPAARVAAHFAAGTSSATGSAIDFGTVQPTQKAVTSADCIVAFGSSNDSSQLRAQQADGGGNAAYAPSTGALDTSFDADGRNFSSGLGGYDITPYGDGTFVAVGEANTAGWQFQATRFAANGSVMWTSSPAQAGCGDCMAFAVDVVGGGDILLGGHYDSGGADLALMRLKPDGTLRTTWDGDGYSRLVRAGEQRAYDVLEQPGKGYLAAGTSYEGASLAAFVVRYDSLGQLDTSFGSGGMTILQLSGGAERAYQLQLQDDGSILVGGASNSSAFVSRLTPNGQLDTSFGSGGTRTIAMSTGDAWEQEKVGMAIDPVTKDILVTDEFGSSSATSQLAVARMDSAGNMVSTFGTGGVQKYDLLAGGWEDPDGIFVTGDGRIVLPFVREDDSDSGWALRLLPNGARDPSFGANGLFEFSSGTTNDQYGIEVTSDTDGRLVALAGDTVTRLKSTSIPDLVGGSQDWDDGTGMFGACLRALSGGTTDVTTWALDGDASCTTFDTDPWNAIAAGGSKVARRTTPGIATARLRFGLRVPAATAPGAYVAPIRFSVLAPDP